MAKCKNCKNLDHIMNGGVSVGRWCLKKSDSPDIGRDRECNDFKCMTNADRIRNMTDEELAEFLCEYNACYLCKHNDQTCNSKVCDEIGITESWLKSEVGCECND